MQWLSKLVAPFFDWIQVEVTSHCNAECIYCPHTAYRESWQSVSMPIERYEKLAHAFARTSLVYLQGWGEPLIHPQFFEMVQFARECGCQVGTTTNGMLVGEKVAERIVREGLSIVGFSLAGSDESQDKVRRHTQLKRVLQAIRLIDETKKSLGASNPQVHVAYLWLRSKITDVKELPALLEGTGVRQVVVSTLDFVPHPDLATEAVQARDDDEEAFLRHMISEVVEAGEKRGLELFFRLLAPYRAPGFCTENVTKSLFISSLGFVSPCVFKNLPITQSPRIGELGESTLSRLRYGNIEDRSLFQIWRDKPYKAFRREHAQGRGVYSCGECPKLFYVT